MGFELCEESLGKSLLSDSVPPLVPPLNELMRIWADLGGPEREALMSLARELAGGEVSL
jgi:hypothetical protein